MGLDRKNRTLLGVFLIVGFGLVAWSSAAGVGGPAIALELGAALGLAVVVWIFERQLHRDIDRIDAEIVKLRESVEVPPNEAAAAAVERRTRAIGDVFSAFEQDPSLSTYRAITDEFAALNISVPANLYPTDLCLINVSPVQDVLRFKIRGNHADATGSTDAAANWREDQPYDEFIGELEKAWISTRGLYPGKEWFKSYNLAQAIADELRARYDKAVTPEAP